MSLLVRLLCLLSLAVAFSCRYSPLNSEIALSEEHTVVLLDSAAAAQAVIRDSIDEYFMLASDLDMALQMGRRYPAQAERRDILTDYHRFLQADVRDFSPREAALLTGIWQELYPWVQSLSPDILLPRIELIKSAAGPYGPGVYYTRENRIVIPEDELETDNRANLLRVMLHEIFHIYSRYNPAQRRRLYRLIGYVPLPTDHWSLLADTPLRTRLLLNPDGTEVGFARQVVLPSGDSTMVVPLLWSPVDSFEPQRPDYFDYVNFELFEVYRQGDRYRVRTQADGSSTLPATVPVDLDFYNTDYIIHPDEILADNFAILVLQRAAQPAYADHRYTPEGRELLSRMEAILR